MTAQVHKSHHSDSFGLDQWFSTFPLKRVQSKSAILLESRTKKSNTNQLTRFVLLQNEVCYTKY